VHQELDPYGLPGIRRHVYQLINPCVSIFTLVKDGLQDRARCIRDVGVLPVKHDRVSREVPVPEAERALTGRDCELLVKRAVAKGLRPGHVACQCRERPAVYRGCANYGIVLVSIDHPWREATGLESAILNKPRVTLYWSWCRCGCARWGRRWRWGWRRTRYIARRLNYNKLWRDGLKESYGSICKIRRLISVKPEVVQCAEANRVCILILRKSFRAPGNRARVLSYSPRLAAVALVA
jgi:hypothetical protein